MERGVIIVNKTHIIYPTTPRLYVATLPVEI